MEDISRQYKKEISTNDKTSVTFSLNKVSSSQTNFHGYGCYSKLTRTVRIYCSVYVGTTALSNIYVAIVPAAYRPSANKYVECIVDGYCMVGALAGTNDTAHAGYISQTFSSSYKNCLVVGEYYLDK